MDLQGFDATQIEPNAPREVLPAGNYKAVIVDGEEKANSKQTGSYLQLTLEVIEGPHKGSKLTDRLNLNNPNAQAVEIAQRTLSAICHAVGVMRPRRSEELHGKPLMIKVAVKPADGSYGPSNEIKGYEPCVGAPSGQASEAPKTAAWKRR